MTSQVRIDAEVNTGQADKAVSGLRSSLMNLGGEAKKSILTGVGLGAGLGAWNLLSGGIHDAIGFMGDSIKAAETQEASLAALTAALKQNDAGWDGNVDSIQKVIESRLKLGFTTQEQEASLAVLVAMTKDHTASLDIERTAMDISRLKHIDLATASTLLGKAFEGNTAGLRRLGIVVASGTKGYDALEQVQKRVAGQAEAFSHTTAGAAAALGAEFEGLQEKVGQALLPVMNALFHVLADNLIPAFQGLVGVITGIPKEVWIGIALAIAVAFTPAIIGATIASAAFLLAWAPVVAAIAGAVFIFMKAIEAVNHFALDFGSMGARIHEVADKSGRDYTQVKDAISALMDKGMGFDEAAATVEKQLKKTPAVAMREGHRAIDAYAKGVTDGTPAAVVKFQIAGMSAAAKLALGYQSVWLTKSQELIVSAGMLPGEIADAIRANELIPQTAFQHMLDLMDKPMTEATRMAYDLGVLHSKKLAAGLRSGDPAIRQAAIAAKEAATEDLLHINLYLTGQHILQTLINGMRSMYGAVHTAAILAGTNISGPLKFSNPPREGPLSDIRSWMPHMAEQWASSLPAAKAVLGRAARQLADAASFTGSGNLAAGQGLVPAMAAAGSGTRIGAEQIHYHFEPHLTVQGDVKARNREEIETALVRLSRFSPTTLIRR
jgi:hypothetical protein